jgi:hypothetical protein
MTRGHGSRRPVTAPGKVRLARKAGTCCLCGNPIAKGQRVGLLLAGWAHNSPCIVRRRQLPGTAVTDTAHTRADQHDREH